MKKTYVKGKMYATLCPSMVSNLDLIGELKEGISYYEKLIKRAQKNLVSYIKKHRLQSQTIRGDNFLGNYMAKQNERISKTMLKEMLSEKLIGKCTIKSKKYEWVKTNRIKPSRKK
jgi:hypothetical protein